MGQAASDGCNVAGLVISGGSWIRQRAATRVTVFESDSDDDLLRSACANNSRNTDTDEVESKCVVQHIQHMQHNTRFALLLIDI